MFILLNISSINNYVVWVYLPCYFFANCSCLDDSLHLLGSWLLCIFGLFLCLNFVIGQSFSLWFSPTTFEVIEIAVFVIFVSHQHAFAIWSEFKGIVRVFSPLIRESEIGTTERKFSYVFKKLHPKYDTALLRKF